MNCRIIEIDGKLYAEAFVLFYGSIGRPGISVVDSPKGMALEEGYRRIIVPLPDEWQVERVTAELC